MKFCVKILFLTLILSSITVYSQDSLRVFDGVAAEVGGCHITIQEVIERARRILEAEGIPATETELKNRLAGAYSAALTNLIDRQLILLRYEQAEQKLPEWVFSRRIESVIEDRFGGDRSQLVSMLAKHGISYEKWKKEIEEETIVGAMKQQFVDQGITLRPDDIRSIYEKNFANKKLDGPVRLSMIMLERDEGQAISNVLASANVIVKKLRSGENFANFAKKYSKEPHAADGGDWGYIDPAESLRKELADAVKKLKVNSISDPIVIADRYVYILKKVDEQKDLKIPFEVVRNEIEAKLRSEMASERFDSWLESLRQTTSIRIYKPTP